MTDPRQLNSTWCVIIQLKVPPPTKNRLTMANRVAIMGVGEVPVPRGALFPTYKIGIGIRVLVP